MVTPRTRKHQSAGSLRIEARSASAANGFVLGLLCCFCDLFVTPPVIEISQKIDRVGLASALTHLCLTRMWGRTIFRENPPTFGLPTDYFRKCTH
ncbi:hypothetical protein PC114_g19636 [Phytophthora cactorum]|nr:hypothetical protein PC114_g19636 [Phytophthora cactorum]KAG3005861.1 hypothetical protein PC120_g17724 [Phytophthora cactorum]